MVVASPSAPAGGSGVRARLYRLFHADLPDRWGPPTSPSAARASGDDARPARTTHVGARFALVPAARAGENGEDGDTKSHAGRRVVGLPGPLVELLVQHWEQQKSDRARARQLWRESGRVFTSATGEPTRSLDPNDRHRWKALLKAAGVRDARLHDARHTAATDLLVLGVPERTVGLMGWSGTARHGPIRRTVADQVGGLWRAQSVGPS